MRLYYAQNKEDLFIKSFFPDVSDGFYIDVGANDPVIDSVTKLLYDEGWHGINVEPIGSLAGALRSARPRDTTLQVGLSNRPGELTFTEYPEGNGLSTFSASTASFYKKGKHPFPTAKTKEYRVPVRTLKDVLDELRPAHIHVLKVDVEGYEYEVLEGNDWQRYRPELICIEANHIDHDWRPMLEKHRYQLVFFDGINNYYLARESLKRQKYFDYADTVFSGNPIYYPASLEVQISADAALRAQVDILSAKLQEQEERVAYLHRQQRDVRFLAKQLAKEVQLRLHKRAHGTGSRAGLVYRGDESLKEKSSANNKSPEQMLAFIHVRDRKNIAYRAPRSADTLRPVPWKVAAMTFDLALATGKKVRRGRG